MIGIPDGSVGKEFTCNAEDPGLIPGSGRSPREGIGYPQQYSWALLVTQLVKNLPEMRETWVHSPDYEDPWRKERLPTPGFWRILENSMDYIVHEYVSMLLSQIIPPSLSTTVSTSMIKCVCLFHTKCPLINLTAVLNRLVVKNLPKVQETQV